MDSGRDVALVSHLAFRFPGENVHSFDSHANNIGLETLHRAFDEVLLAVGTAKHSKPDLELTAFFPVAGESCRGKLMVVGRAVNGWGKHPFRAEECQDIKRRREILQDASSNVAEQSSRPLCWVTDKWLSTEPKSYATGRSAFGESPAHCATPLCSAQKLTSGRRSSHGRTYIRWPLGRAKIPQTPCAVQKRRRAYRYFRKRSIIGSQGMLCF
jgi:hypothetical protein